MIPATPPAIIAPAEMIAHVSNSFEFTIDAPLARAAPLFGPEGERSWAGPSWNPIFLYPRPAEDREGAVFTVRHGAHDSVWVNTLFDLDHGRMQYVAVIPGIVATVIDVRLFQEGAGTRARVSYTRTALTGQASADVTALGQKDAASAEEWRSAIAAALEAQR